MPVVLRRRSLLLATALTTLQHPGHAAETSPEDWKPRRPIQIVVGFSPGGGSDLVARGLAQAAAEFSPVALLVMNRPGAAGTLAAQQIARAAADGTQVMVSGGSETTSVPLHRELPYDPFNDFRHLLLVARYPLFLCVRTDSPYPSVGQLLAAARAAPGRLSYGSTGPGGLYHSAFLVLNAQAGTEMLHVPYTGGSPLLTAAAAGEVDVAIASPDEFKGLYDGGVLRLLAVASKARMPGFMTVPTLIESGQDVFIENMKGLSVPAGTPEPVCSWLQDTFHRALTTASWTNFASHAGILTSYADGLSYSRDLRAVTDSIGAALRRQVPPPEVR